MEYDAYEWWWWTCSFRHNRLPHNINYLNLTDEVLISSHNLIWMNVISILVGMSVRTFELNLFLLSTDSKRFVLDLLIFLFNQGFNQGANLKCIYISRLEWFVYFRGYYNKINFPFDRDLSSFIYGHAFKRLNYNHFVTNHFLTRLMCRFPRG